MVKTKAKQRAQDVKLVDVWSDPPVEEIGATARTISNKDYRRALADLQVELAKLQEWVRVKGLKIVVVFEGRDAAGKGGSARGRSGISSATSPTCRPPARSCSSTGAGTTGPASSA